MNIKLNIAVNFVILVTALIVFSFFPVAAYASCSTLINSTSCMFYIDPGTGSMIIQVIIGALIGGATAIGIYWNRVKTFFINKLSKVNKNERSGNNQ